MIIVLAVIGVVVLAFIGMYNSLVRLRNNVKKSFAGIDVQLKRRTDLIPNLINTVKGYAAHEKELLESLTKARTSIINGSASGNVNAMAEGENMLSGALKSIFAVAENYPDLKANQNFLELQESLEETFATAFGNIAHLGGSAGDDLKLEATYVFYNGEFHRDAAVLLLVGTGKPFTVFSIDHINSPVSKLVVTHADPESRTVYEINGEPAAQYYASLLGMKAEDLTPDVFSMFPLAVMVGGKYFIRSIQKVDLATNAITFYCAVDIGIILTFVQLGDCIEALESKLDKLRAQLGEPEFVYACDCFLRRLEIQQGENDHEIRRLQQRYNVAGFNAYGEHIHSVHLNQTFTGVYFAAQ